MGRRSRQKRLNRGRRLRRLAAVVLVSVALLSTSLAAGLLFSALGGDGPRAGSKTAAIVDQLSEREPNPAFIAAATGILEQAGYVVDYFPAEQVTVDFYRELPTYSHDLIVLRVHSTRLLEDEQGNPVDEVVLFTSEPYTRGKYTDQGKGRLARTRYHQGAQWLFGIRADFITSSMRGEFEDAPIIMMGCKGLTSANETARAFVLKGAASFISWDNLVSGSHSDAATERLLQLMLTEGLPTVDAVVRTDAEVGPDPAFGARLHILTP